MGSNEKDDFYASVNKEVLDKLDLKPGRVIAGTLYDLQDDSTEKVNKIIKDAIEKGGTKGSKEQKIADFYRNIPNRENRNKIGVAPIKMYLDKINSAKNVSELAEVQTELIKKSVHGSVYGIFSYNEF